MRLIEDFFRYGREDDVIVRRDEKEFLFINERKTLNSSSASLAVTGNESENDANCARNYEQ